MKRGMLVLVLALLAIVCLPATPFEATELGEGGSSTLSVTLDLSTASTDEFEIGFTQDPNLETSIAYNYAVPSADSLSLDPKGGVASIKEGEKLFIYWIVRSAEKFKASLYVDAALHTDEGDGDDLDWTISWNDGQTRTIGGADNYNTTGVVFLDRSNPTNNGVIGYYPVTITTSDYTEKLPGVYTGSLTIKVEPVEV